MDRFRELEVFTAVAEAEGFNAGARKLGISAPSATRIIGALEIRLGARLFTRTTRRLALTEAGTRLLGDAQRILTDLREAEVTAAGLHQSPRGMLRITAPVLFGETYLAPLLRAYLDRYPEVSVTAIFANQVVDLIDEGIDLALRIAELPESGLVAIRIGEVRRVVVASPDYAARHGLPETPADLAEHAVIGTTNLEGAQIWRFETKDGPQQVRLAPRLTVTSIAASIDAAIAGWGIARTLSYQLCHPLSDGRLVECLPGTDSRRIPVHLVHHEGRGAAARVRAFLEMAVPALRAQGELFAAQPER